MPELASVHYLVQVDCVPAIAAWPLRIRALVNGVWEWVKRHADSAVLLLDTDGATFSVALQFHRAKTMRDTRRLLAGALALACYSRVGDGALEGEVTIEDTSEPAWESYINVLRAEPAALEPTFLRFRALAATTRNALLLEHFPPVMPPPAPPHALELLACGTDAERLDAHLLRCPDVPIDAVMQARSAVVARARQVLAHSEHEPTRAAMAAMDAEDTAASESYVPFTMPAPVAAADADPSYDRTVGMVQLLRSATLGAARDGCSFAIRRAMTECTGHTREFSMHRVGEWASTKDRPEVMCAQVRVRVTHVLEPPDASGVIPLPLNAATTRLHFLAADGEPTPVTVSIGAVFVDVLDGFLEAGAWLLTLSSVLPQTFIHNINRMDEPNAIVLSFGFTGMPEPFINLSRIDKICVRGLDAARPPVRVQQEHINVISVVKHISGRFIAGIKYSW